MANKIKKHFFLYFRPKCWLTLQQFMIAAYPACESLSTNHNLFLFLTLYRPLFFVLEILSAFYACYISSVHFRLGFFMEANAMNPDQTAPKRAV